MILPEAQASGNGRSADPPLCGVIQRKTGVLPAIREKTVFPQAIPLRNNDVSGSESGTERRNAS